MDDNFQIQVGTSKGLEVLNRIVFLQIFSYANYKIDGMNILLRLSKKIRKAVLTQSDIKNYLDTDF